MFSYCGNNPVNRAEFEGNYWDTVFDVASLVLSIGDVASDPTDIGAWAGLVCDVVDVVIPFVSGLGETARAVNAALDVADAMDDIHDATKVADAIDDATDTYKAVSGGLCFVAGTEVLCEDGTTTIESIQPGDLVWAWDEEADTVELKEVVETYVSETTELIHVFVGAEEIVATPAHPFYSPVKGWTEAVHLRAGDILVLVNGEYVVVEKVQHEILDAPVTVYNFHVADFHTYYVSATGVLVHNSCAQSKRFDENQQVVLELAKEYKNGMSRSEAETLVDWAKEYGIDAHYPGKHENRSGKWSVTEHINIRNIHIPILE